jgi:bifunctional non-homologous end joining protein LigD
MSLAEYRRKRHFTKTAEPAGKAAKRSKNKKRLSFVIQKHAASHLHFDFRLELDGVLKSWAVPKGPSLDPNEKRLAVAVEDHPLEYAKFEGTIPEGEYGAGEVIVWDRGHWEPDGDPRQALTKGKLEFVLDGERLRGAWRLLQLRGREGGRNWLLVKRNDETAQPSRDFDVTAAHPDSVVTGRTLEELATNGHASAPKKARKTARASPRAKRAPPKKVKAKSARSKSTEEDRVRFIAPQLATLSTTVPTGSEWIYELKYDGYRLIATVDHRKARLWTRNELDWTNRFGSVAAEVAKISAESAVLDGEIVALDENGLTDFQALQNSLQGIESRPLVYYAFDLLQLDGADLRRLPLIERKEQLRRLLGKDQSGRVRFSDHLDGEGKLFLQECCRRGVEGIIAKRGDRPYISGRTNDWLKIKCQQEEEFVIAGFTLSEAEKRGFGALLVGYYQDGKLTYAGRVGTGYSAKLLVALREQLDTFVTEHCPFASIPKRERGNEVRWVQPKLVAQVRFTGWTTDKLLRHPAFLGLREDKTARSVGLPESLLNRDIDVMPTTGKQTKRVKRTRAKATSPSDNNIDFPLTNPQRVLFPDVGLTKLDLASYYQDVSEWMLPYLKDRPLSLLRCPEGQAKKCFFQKHAAAGTPEALRRIEIDEKNERETYLIADDLPGLLSLAQMGVLEIHVWGSRGDRLEQPDWLVFDLDPAPEVAWKEVVASAEMLRDLLAEIKLQTFAKLTGGKGVHLVAPLAPRRAEWPEVKGFAQGVANLLAQEYPERFIAKMSKAARRGKIFVDYLRNDRGSTAIAPFSTRAKPGAPVAVPITWDELTPAIAPDQFNVSNVRERLAKLKPDPWAGFAEVKQRLPKLSGVK